MPNDFNEPDGVLQTTFRIAMFLILWPGTVWALIFHAYTAYHAESLAFLVIGMILTPIGILHGWSATLGFPWV